MVVRCTVQFNNNVKGIFFAGEMLFGKVILQCDKPKKIEGIQLKIKGFSHTRWTETSSTTTSTGNGGTTTITTSTTYSGHEDFIKTKLYLSSIESVIAPGTHAYSFSCRIPERCPTSFECNNGHIRYLVKVVLVRPWKFDQSYTRAFTVLNIFNLNYAQPSLRSPAYQHMTRVFGVWPFKSAPMQISVNVPQGGYVPGQSIPVGVLINNESNIKLKQIKAELVMNVRCYSQFPSKRSRHERIVLTKFRGDASVLRHSKKLFVYNMKVPTTPPTCLNLSSIIFISYEVEVHIEVAGLHHDTKLCVPVTIGSVPLVGAPAQLPMLPSGGALVAAQALPALPAAEIAPTAPLDKAVEAAEINLQAQPLPADNMDDPPAYSGATAGSYNLLEGLDFPPPTYEAATHVPTANVTADEKHDFGISEFVPQYPCYNIASPMAPTMEELESFAAAHEKPEKH